MVSDVSGWWGGCEAVKVWIDGAEKTLSADTPLASSMDIVQQQKRNIEVKRNYFYTSAKVPEILI